MHGSHVHEHPRDHVTLWHLFRTFLFIGVTSLGGGPVPHVHAAVVRKRRWLSEEEFLEGVTFAQLTPGPNFSNLATYIGARLGGTPGALLALLAVLLPGALVVIALAQLYLSVPVNDNPYLKGVLRGVASAAIGLLAVVVLQTLPAALRSRHGLPVLLLAFLSVGLMRVNIVWALAILLPYSIWANRPTQEADPHE